MHWFWRAMMAAILASVFAKGVHFTYSACYLLYLGTKIPPAGFPWWGLPLGLLTGIPLALIAIWIYDVLTRRYHPKRHFLDGETRCRKCGYILRGISEPRCSECGEKI